MCMYFNIPFMPTGNKASHWSKVWHKWASCCYHNCNRRWWHHCKIQLKNFTNCANYPGYKIKTRKERANASKTKCSVRVRSPEPQENLQCPYWPAPVCESLFVMFGNWRLHTHGLSDTIAFCRFHFSRNSKFHTPLLPFRNEDVEFFQFCPEMGFMTLNLSHIYAWHFLCSTDWCFL